MFHVKTNKRQTTAYLKMLNELQTLKNFKIMEENKVTENVTENVTKANGFSFAKSYNKVNFSVDITDFEFCKLSELYKPENPNEIYGLSGLWVNTSPLGKAPVFIVQEIGKLVNMPSHLTSTAQEILNDKNAVEAIESGNVGFTVYEYESHAKKCYGIRFVDIVKE